MRLNITFYVHCRSCFANETNKFLESLCCVCVRVCVRVLHLSAFEIGEGYSQNLLRILCHSSTPKRGIFYVSTISYRHMTEVQTFEVETTLTSLILGPLIS
jgi:hypothetical protein